MEYIKRELERKFAKINAAFKAVMITGARQVGKTTMLMQLARKEGRTFVTMDDMRNRELARRDPRLFFQMYKPPILIDEVQKAPELFETMKMICDESEETGLFWMTGSESTRMLQEARESMTGRIGILRMYSLSQREKSGLADLGMPDFDFSSLVKRSRQFPKNDIVSVFGHIWHGGMPGTMSMDNEQLYAYYQSYINTYLMRDATDDYGIHDTEGFYKALRACAAFTGNLINYSDIARAAGVSTPTAQQWVKALQNMGIIYLLEPYYNNELKRLIKTPKLYFLDTGLCAYLSMWTSRDVLMQGAASGHYFENYVVGELLRSCSCSAEKTMLSFYRDTNQNEIDLILECGGELHPLEIKQSTTPEHRAIKAFSLLDRSSVPVGNGGIICMTDTVFPIDKKNALIPCNIL